MKARKPQRCGAGGGALVIGGLPQAAPRPYPAVGTDPESIAQAADHMDGDTEFARDGDQAVFTVEVAVGEVGGQVGESQRVCAGFEDSPVRAAGEKAPWMTSRRPVPAGNTPDGGLPMLPASHLSGGWTRGGRRLTGGNSVWFFGLVLWDQLDPISLVVAPTSC